MLLLNTFRLVKIRAIRGLLPLLLLVETATNDTNGH